MKTNRQKRSNEIADIYSQLYEATSLHCAHLENIAALVFRVSLVSFHLLAPESCEQLLHVFNKILILHTFFDMFSLFHVFRTMCVHRKNSDGVRVNQLQRAGRTLFFLTVSSITSLEMIFPATARCFSAVIKKLGEVIYILFLFLSSVLLFLFFFISHKSYAGC